MTDILQSVCVHAHIWKTYSLYCEPGERQMRRQVWIYKVMVGKRRVGKGSYMIPPGILIKFHRFPGNRENSLAC